MSSDALGRHFVVMRLIVFHKHFGFWHEAQNVLLCFWYLQADQSFYARTPFQCSYFAEKNRVEDCVLGEHGNIPRLGEEGVRHAWNMAEHL